MNSSFVPLAFSSANCASSNSICSTVSCSVLAFNLLFSRTLLVCSLSRSFLRFVNSKETASSSNCVLVSISFVDSPFLLASSISRLERSVIALIRSVSSCLSKSFKALFLSASIRNNSSIFP